MASRRIGLWTALGLVFTAASPGSAQDLQQLFHQVKPAVVVILTQESAGPVAEGKQPTSIGGLGSGFLISEDGLVMTAAHVVQTAEKIAVAFGTGKDDIVPARVVSSVPSADIALIKVAGVPSGVKPLKLANSDEVRVGEQVFVVGAPYGLSYTLTVGHLSGVHTPSEVFAGFTRGQFLQTDAAVNQGNSGGPMFNMNGHVIGVVSYIISQSGGFEGLGFAVSSNLANELLLKRRSPWFGVDAMLLSGRLAEVFNLPQEAGLLVQKVAANSPGSRIGLRGGDVTFQVAGQEVKVGGDIVLAVGGIRVDGTGERFIEMLDLFDTLEPRSTVEIEILRAGKVETLDYNFMPHVFNPEVLEKGGESN